MCTYTLVLRKNMMGVLVNGVFNHLALSLSGGAVQVFQEGFRYAITTGLSLHVTYDLVFHVTVIVPGNYRGNTNSLSGNFNGNRGDDFLLPYCKLTKDVNTFGKLRKVAIPGKVCDNGCARNTCPKCDPARRAMFEKPLYCGVITAPKGPFATCHSKLDTEPYFNNCIFDVCASEGDGNVLCDSVAAYSFNCHMAGVDIKNWRTASFCPMKCPANSQNEGGSEPASQPGPGSGD
ncbi:IgGFc-binding protein [Coregonus clupeaformis]|uniref:IgGFc-binding protein n=1 Tax=Coregonus clupeaformis TaxID=59861 RepID=UPI001BE00B13|nr:IgGFc-binding protein [Coregonus clupeaformis]